MRTRRPHRLLAGAALVIACAFGTTSTDARPPKSQPEPVPVMEIPAADLREARRMAGLPIARSASASTTFLGSFTFDSGPTCVDEGWVAVDYTSLYGRIGEMWHVDDFAGLGGGDLRGFLRPPAGLQALWCGARPSSDPDFCRYAALPGYGNSWDFAFCTKDTVFGTDVSVNFSVHWDSEPAYDFTFVEIDDQNDVGENWIPRDLSTFPWGGASGFTSWGTDTAMCPIPDSLHTGAIKIRFHFASDGAWSDEDGLWNTDGAIVIDDLSVTSNLGVQVPLEDFEGEALGAHESDDWEACSPQGFGTFASVMHASDILQLDPCAQNASCVWNFFTGSSYVYDCVVPSYPTQQVVPYQDGHPTGLNVFVESPMMPLVGSGSQYEIAFDVYRDLPLENLVFYNWEIRSIVGGCAGAWQNRTSVYYGGQKDWYRAVHPVGDLVDPAATDVQIALRAFDMCFVWCGVFGTGACHSNAPLFDNVDVYRIDSQGPDFFVRDFDQFQDTFEEVSGPTAGTARADMARDILPSSSPNIVPGDSVLIMVDDPEVGLAGDPLSGFGSAVYCYVSVWPQGQANKTGDHLTQDSFRWPAVGTTVADGVTWTCLRMDTTFNGPGRTDIPIENTFCIDLNDNLFEAGDTVCFFYGAESTNGKKRYYNVMYGPAENIDEIASNADEFTVLPAGGVNNGGDILYVDGMNGRGAQVYFDTAFELMSISHGIDRYDIRGPSSGVGNHPASRVNDVAAQLNTYYPRILWNTGDLDITIGDGSGSPEKSDDASLLFSFLEQLTNTGGVWISGDDAADQMKQSTAPGMMSLLSKYMNYTLDDPDHVNFGLGNSPLGVGVAGKFSATQLIAYGGCPAINDFDVMSASGASAVLINYEGNGVSGGALIGQTTLNPNGFNVGFLLQGFSFHEIRDDTPAGIPDRAVFLSNVGSFLNNTYPNPVGTGAATKTTLAQNYPNPFNPTTTIRYSLAERTHVKLHIYNVAGQRVRTLVDGIQAPESGSGGVFEVVWRGRNDGGTPVASGVYFYRLVAGEFTETRKMLLLK